MHTKNRIMMLAMVTLCRSLSGAAAAPADPAGHWEGAFQGPGSDMIVAIDLVKNVEGKFTGTLSVPDQKLTGLPLHKIAVEGQTVNLYAREDQPFAGVLSEDGKSMSAIIYASGFEIHGSLSRTGEARMEPPARIAPIPKELEGTWTGQVGGERLVLKMTNRPDGTSTANFLNLDEGGLEIPVSAITQSSAGLTLDLKAIDGSYTAALNREGTELAGKYQQGGQVIDLTFHRAAADGKK